MYVCNPMNDCQVSEICLAFGVIDYIIFWTKNPIPMMERLDELKEYAYYFQFMLAGYGRDAERNLPDNQPQIV